MIFQQLRLVLKPFLLPSLFVVALLIRLAGLEHGISFHPDERHVIMTANKLSWADPNPHFFAYGSFPFYLLWGVGSFVSLFSKYYSGYDGLFIVGRILSALFGAAGVLGVYWLSKRIFNCTFIALTAALLITFNPLHVQLSHFYAFDVVLTTLNTFALLAACCIAQGAALTLWLPTFILLAGLSLATKISALWLVLPLALALAARVMQGQLSISHILSSCVLFGFSVLGILVVFIAAEPYAILDYTTFLANNQEQIGFVRGLWRPPYGIQYENTAAYLYPMEQMAKFAIGWVPTVLAALGALNLTRLQFTRGPRVSEVIILSWIYLVFISVAGLQIKFPRYLLPIYPALLICAAYALSSVVQSLQRSLGLAWARSALLCALVASTLPALALVSIYKTPHVYSQASEWIYANLQQDRTILHPHWDDTLPLHLPGRPPSLFHTGSRETELGLYERDTPEKLALVSKQLSSGDYIIFSTPRIPGSLMRVPEEFPQTTALLQLLYKGELGYRMIQSFQEVPRFGPFVFDTTLLDESLSVYDHPKAVIFENVERLTPHEISGRILSASRFAPLPTREELMQIVSSDPTTVTHRKDSSLYAVILWYCAIQLLAFATAPFLSTLLPQLPDRGYGLAKCLGFVVFGYLNWIFPILKLSAGGVHLACAIALIMVGGGILMRRSAQFKPTTRRYVLASEFVFTFTLLGFIIIRSLSSEIFWGEKPMDFTFLNFFVRNESLPPMDPWAAGNTMRYYYLGFSFFASLLKLTAIDPAIGYNLAIATLPAFFASSLFSFTLLLLKRLKLAVCVALLAPLMGNLEVLRLAFIEGRTLNFDLFWASSRLLRSPLITEYPIWSFIFADLHPHVIALPITITAIAIGCTLTLHGNLALPTRITHRVLYGALLGTLFAVNSWDFISYGVFTGFLLALRPLPARLSPFEPRLYTIAHGVKNLIVDSVLIGGAALLISRPFSLTATAQKALEWGWVYDNEFNTAPPLLLHLGLLLIPILIGLLVYEKRTTPSTVAGQAINTAAGLIAAGIPFALAGASVLHGVENLPWEIIGACAFITGFATLNTFQRRLGGIGVRTIGALLCSAATILCVSELYYLFDRMNTVFKFYNAVWVLLLCAAIGMIRPLIYLWQTSREKFFQRCIITVPVAIVVIACLLSFAAGVLDIGMMATFRRTKQPALTLNGVEYLEERSIDESEMVHWLRTNIEGLPTILEAQGQSYAAFTRISMLTGLPTLLGWEHHVSQRGTARDDIERRKRSIQLIYSSTDEQLAEQLLTQFDVSLIVVSTLEHETYPAQGLKKFAEHPEMFIPLFKKGDAAVYAVARQLQSSAVDHSLSLEWK